MEKRMEKRVVFWFMDKHYYYWVETPRQVDEGLEEGQLPWDAKELAEAVLKTDKPIWTRDDNFGRFMVFTTTCDMCPICNMPKPPELELCPDCHLDCYGNYKPKQDLARYCMGNYGATRHLPPEHPDRQQAEITCQDCQNDKCIRCERPELWIENWEENDD